MARKSPIRGLYPVYRVYLAGFAMFVGAVASFAAGVKVLGFVFFALVLVCGGIMTVLVKEGRVELGGRALTAWSGSLH